MAEIAAFLLATVAEREGFAPLGHFQAKGFCKPLYGESISE